MTPTMKHTTEKRARVRCVTKGVVVPPRSSCVDFENIERETRFAKLLFQLERHATQGETPLTE